MTDKETWEVKTIAEVDGRTRWYNIGVGFENKDGSFNLYLHAVPINGKIHMKKKDYLETSTQPHSS